MKFISIALGILAGTLFAFLSWKYSHLFISRQETNRKSKYEIFLVKLGWALSFGLGGFLVMLALIGYLYS